MKTKNRLKLLIVADQEDQFGEIKNILIRAGLDFKDSYCRSLKTFTTQLHDQDPHVIILFGINEVLTPELISNYLKEFHIPIPVLLMIPEGLEDTAIKYIPGVIDDYVITTHFKRLPVAVIIAAGKKVRVKSQEQSLRFMLESEKRWNAIFNSEPECIIITLPGGEVAEINPSGLQLMETNQPKKIIQHAIWQFIHPDDVKGYKKFHNAIARGNHASLQFRVISLKGKTRWLSANGTPLRDGEQHIISVLMIARDVTDFIDIQNELKEKELKYRNLSTYVPVGIFHTDTTGDCFYVNPFWSKLTGLSQEEAKGKGWADAIHPDDKEFVFREWYYAVKNQIPFREEFRYQRADKETIWVSVSAIALINEQGEITSYLGTVTDINDNKQFEEALIESQTRLEAAQELAKVGDWDWDILTKTGSWSKEMYPIHDRNPEEGPPEFNEFLSLILPDDREKVMSFQQKVIQTGHAIGEDYRILLKDGNVRQVYPTAYCMYDRDGTPTKIIGTLIDVTERVKTHESIRKNEQLINVLYSQTLDGMFEMKFEKPIIWDDQTDKETMLEYAFKNGRITRVNDVFLEIHGSTREKMIGLTPGEYYSAKEKEENKQLWREFFDHGRARNEILTHKFDKTPIWLQGDYICVYDSDGRITGHLGFQRDITKEKTAIEELKFSERNFREIFENSPDGIYIEDYNGIILNLNEEACKIQGLPKEELLGKNILDLTPDDKKEIVYANFKKFCEGSIDRLDAFSWDKEWNPIPMEIKVNRIVYSGIPAVLLHVRDIRIKKLTENVQALISQEKK